MPVISGESNFIVRFLSDTTGYNPASKVRQQNQAIAASNEAAIQRNVAAQERAAAGLARRASIEKAFRPVGPLLSEIGTGPSVAWQNPITSPGYSVARQNPITSSGYSVAWQNPITSPGPFGHNRIGSITALPSGPSAIAGSLFGRTAGIAADIGVVGGLLPEGLSAAAAGIGIAAIAAGLFTVAVIGAAKQLNTIESIQLSKAFFSLKLQTTYLLAEIGQLLLPVITELTRSLTQLVRGVRWLLDILGYTNRIYGSGRAPTDIEGPVGNRREPQATEVGGGGRTLPRLPHVPFFPNDPFAAIRGITRMFDSGGQSSIPGMQSGGIVRPRPGGVLARLAEGGEAEAVIPLRRFSEMMYGGGVTRTDQQQKEQADLLQTSLSLANALPPLYTRLDLDEGEGEFGGEQQFPVPPNNPVLRYLTQTEYDTLANPTGWFAIYQG